MKKTALLIAMITVSGAAMATVIYSTDFTGYSDGLLSSSGQGWNASKGWYTATGVTTSSNNWSQAQQATANSRVNDMAEGDSITITSEFDLSSIGTMNNQSFFNLGVSDSAKWAGAGVTDLGMTITVFQSGWYVRGLGDSTVNGPWKSGLFDGQVNGSFTLTGTFEKSATADEFLTTITLGNAVNPNLTTLTTTLTSANVYDSTSLELGMGAVVIDSTSGFNMKSIQLDAIPEPATLGLIATFAGATLFIRRRFMM
ncbi:PEP-CTERM sorting domain-containing protein [Pontiella sulfatireligans]|uniref:PEP-CTERM protein-sorting domain-containing protein n=1 Tax=Pontiella sulfatireligans TaxID=2750658 RepID=A0A6C2UQA0_9BACT|nr:PEP-CTERM sorting domain-containing protein [Pontiella sulfatireligans]VGO22465.1 hypothetical protein SCARR_04548 [Pontiella sulfatireligans]